MTGVRSSTWPFLRVRGGACPSSLFSSLLSGLVRESSVTVNSGSLVARRFEIMFECSLWLVHRTKQEFSFKVIKY